MSRKRNAKSLTSSQEIEGIDKAMMSIGNGSCKPWESIRSAANDVRGGDRWKTRGTAGTWHRWHITPRRALFTPFRVPKGPGKDLKLKQARLTVGVTKSGEHFEIVDDWSRQDTRHRRLDEQWIGYTVFTEDKVESEDFHQRRAKICRSLGTQRWADASESE